MPVWTWRFHLGGGGRWNQAGRRRGALRGVASVVAMAWCCGASAAAGQGARIGHRAPGFGLPTLSGDSLSLPGLRGHPVLLAFWATWCPSCRAEMPELARVGAAHAGVGLMVVTIDADQTRERVLEYAGAFPTGTVSGLTWLLDHRSRVARQYHIPVLPSAVFVDSDGVVRAIHHGAMSAAELADGIRAILPTNQQE
ncbi:MAG: TlpA family protein disulfide reductase [Gemmatimonadales bacterium]